MIAKILLSRKKKQKNKKTKCRTVCLISSYLFSKLQASASLCAGDRFYKLLMVASRERDRVLEWRPTFH